MYKFTFVNIKFKFDNYHNIRLTIAASSPDEAKQLLVMVVASSDDWKLIS